jgi:hypothetical protein
MGEYVVDKYASHNAASLHQLGMWAAGYWFVRATGCQSEAKQIVAEAKALGIKIVVLDSEVPEARGYTACLAPSIKSAGLIVLEYTSPGSNPDSVNPGLNEWVAAYGPAHVPCVFTCNVNVAGKQSILAWQCTDGRFGCVISVPGIGLGDVSVDYGITKVGAPPPPPVWTFNHAFQVGFTRGFDVGWLRRHHLPLTPFRIAVPSASRGAFNLGFQDGFKAAYR